MMALATMARQLGGEVHGGRISCPGPGHSRQDRSLSVWFDGDGRLHVCSFAGDDWQECMDYARARLGLPAFDPGQRQEPPPPRFRDRENERIEAASREQKTGAAQRLFAEGVHPVGTPVETYFAERRLPLDLLREMAIVTIRFHPACPFQDIGRHPAMICRYSPIEYDLDPEAPPSAIHRTALRDDGSWHLGERAKQMLGPVGSHAIKLSPDSDVCEGLGICEGVETGLKVIAGGFRPVWALGSAGGIERFPVLGGVQALTIFADHDQAGLSAAQACAERWSEAGREVFIRWPRDLGSDYADEEMP